MILDAYTVYLDLWLCDLEGRVIANGRPERYSVKGLIVSREPWFAARGRADVRRRLHGRRYQPVQPAQQCAGRDLCGLRPRGGETSGRPLGVLAIHFDWAPQARTIVKGARLDADEWQKTTVMLVDAKRRIIASSNDSHSLADTFSLEAGGRTNGYYVADDQSTVAFHATPGYETYKGLGWYGVIKRKP